MLRKRNIKPNLFYALKLKCPYCGDTSLLKPGRPLEFGTGCKACDYVFEREVGYFSGAAWMITYLVAALSAMAAGGFLIWKFNDLSDFAIAGIPAAFGGVMALIFIPLGRSIWMYIDHVMHPLTDNDKYKEKTE